MPMRYSTLLFIMVLRAPLVAAMPEVEPCREDINRDLMIGPLDQITLAVCMTGPATSNPNFGCAMADLQEDRHIDLLDVALLYNKLGPCQLCPGEWIGGVLCVPGVNGAVYSMAPWDFGSGPALYVGGWFNAAGCQMSRNIARWDGADWSTLGEGVAGSVHAIAGVDHPAGSALYVGGYFAKAGGLDAINVAKWDGSRWSALGEGLNGSVTALAAYDDGSGPALYVGGWFTSAGGRAVSHIAKWDGLSWSAVGGGTNGPVVALTVFDDGDGPVLYAGGYFRSAGLVPGTRHIARWDGTNWSGLDGWSGLSSVKVNAFALLDDESGPSLIVGGDFYEVAGMSGTEGVARWNGSEWSALREGLYGVVDTFAVFDDGSGPRLNAAGALSIPGTDNGGHFLVWDGQNWSSVGASILPPDAMVAFDDGGGPALFLGGHFDWNAGTGARSIIKWNGSYWESVGRGVSGQVSALHVVESESAALYMGGQFAGRRSGRGFHGVARWNGAGLESVGEGVPPHVYALTSRKEEAGMVLYAGGYFPYDDDWYTGSIARWADGEWSEMGGGVNRYVASLLVFDDGAEEALYAAGSFYRAGEIDVRLVAKWNGTQWTALGSGLYGYVASLEAFDDGKGPRLFAGGEIAVESGNRVVGVAQWDGVGWSTVGSGLTGDEPVGVNALIVHDTGGGPALVAGGRFSRTGEFEVDNIAQWNGEEWLPIGSVGSGLRPTAVYDLAVHDDGTGSAIFASGQFANAGGPVAHLVAKLRQDQWIPLGGNFDKPVAALTSYYDKDGSVLVAGGRFSLVGDSVSTPIALWRRPAACGSP